MLATPCRCSMPPHHAAPPCQPHAGPCVHACRRALPTRPPAAAQLSIETELQTKLDDATKELKTAQQSNKALERELAAARAQEASLIDREGKAQLRKQTAEAALADAEASYGRGAARWRVQVDVLRTAMEEVETELCTPRRAAPCRQRPSPHGRLTDATAARAAHRPCALLLCVCRPRRLHVGEARPHRASTCPLAPKSRQHDALIRHLERRQRRRRTVGGGTQELVGDQAACIGRTGHGAHDRDGRGRGRGQRSRRGGGRRGLL